MTVDYATSSSSSAATVTVGEMTATNVKQDEEEEDETTSPGMIWYGIIMDLGITTTTDTTDDYPPLSATHTALPHCPVSVYDMIHIRYHYFLL